MPPKLRNPRWNPRWGNRNTDFRQGGPGWLFPPGPGTLKSGPHGFRIHPGRRLRLHPLTRCIVLLGLIGVLPVTLALAQNSSQDQSIFRRFSDEPETPGSRMGIYEIPVYLRPQTNPDAEIVENLGLNYVRSFFPGSIIFTSLGFNFARMAWRPDNPAIQTEEVKQFDLTFAYNIWIKRSMIVSLGAGLGLMDGLVVNSDGSFHHNLVPYIPMQLGWILPLGGDLRVSLRWVHAPYIGSGPVLGNTRLLAGLGFVY